MKALFFCKLCESSHDPLGPHLIKGYLLSLIHILPICQAVHQALNREDEPARVLEGLFLRSLKKEF